MINAGIGIKRGNPYQKNEKIHEWTLIKEHIET